MPTFVDANGQEYALGNLESPPRYSWDVYGAADSSLLVPRSQWDDLVPEGADDSDPDMPPVHDQNPLQCCNASAVCCASEGTRLASGLGYVSLSAGDLYRRICHGVDQGSYLEDGLREAKRGIATTKTCPYLEWQREMSGAANERPSFATLEWLLCPTFDHMYSAAIKRFRLIIGIQWCNNYQVDRDGWLPEVGRVAVGGHAMCSYKPTRRRGRYGLWTQNSWRLIWGLRGRCVVPETAFGARVGGCWAVRSVVNESGDIPPPIQ